MKKYRQIVASGTFDLLHDGHKSFLIKAFELADEVLVCITSDRYVSTFKKEGKAETFLKRKKNVEEFLRSIDKLDKATIISIEDIFGPLLTNTYSPEAIAVTVENYKNAQEINRRRKEKGLSQVDIVDIYLKPTKGDHGVISSTRIRDGETDRHGMLYTKNEWFSQKLYITDAIRNELKKPFGDLIKLPQEGHFSDLQKIVTVGDESTKLLLGLSIKPSIAVVDFRVAREKKFSSLEELGFDGTEYVTKIENEPGTLTPQLFKAVSYVARGAENQKSVILIDGEEDLAVLPLILALPLRSSVFYGQPGEGMVRVDVSEETKNRAYEIVSSFNTRGH